MADITPARINIQVEDVKYKAAVSEAVGNTLGAAINFINERQHSEKQFIVNGSAGTLATPFNAIDGYVFFEYDATIISAWAYVQNAGSAGTLELDIKLATASGGSFATIFSTTPKFTSAAGSGIWTDSGTTIAAQSGVTKPVLSTTSVNAGDALRMDVITTQTGSTLNGYGIIIHYRPR